MRWVRLRPEHRQRECAGTAGGDDSSARPSVCAVAAVDVGEARAREPRSLRACRRSTWTARRCRPAPSGPRTHAPSRPRRSEAGASATANGDCCSGCGGGSSSDGGDCQTLQGLAGVLHGYGGQGRSSTRRARALTLALPPPRNARPRRAAAARQRAGPRRWRCGHVEVRPAAAAAAAAAWVGWTTPPHPTPRSAGPADPRPSPPLPRTGVGGGGRVDVPSLTLTGQCARPGRAAAVAAADAVQARRGRR